MTACCAAGNGYVSGGRYRGLASEADVVLIKASVDDGRILGKHVAHAIRFPLRYPSSASRSSTSRSACSATIRDLADVEARGARGSGCRDHGVRGGGQRPAPDAAGAGLGDRGDHRGGANDRTPTYPATISPGPRATARPRPGVHKPDLLAPAIWLPAPMLPGTLVAREAAPLFELLSVLEEASAEHGFSETRAGRRTPEERASVQALIDASPRASTARKYISPDYQHVDGTSFASPITASVAAQMLEANPALTPAQIRKGLMGTAEAIPGAPRIRQGAGMLRPKRAVLWAKRQRRLVSQAPSSRARR